ncbi:MAG: hypothetical protein WD749_01720 [Phycisphaerales bacterium]
MTETLSLGLCMTDSAEHFGTLGEDAIEQVCALSFAKDFVFRSPKYFRGKAQKELCDVLVLVEDAAILVEVKTPDMAIARDWSHERAARWTRNKLFEGYDQIRGGFAALLKDLVPEAVNERQGTIRLPGRVKRLYGIVAAHSPPGLELDTTPPRLEVAGRSFEVLFASFYELQAMLRELSTIGDLVDFLDARNRVVRRGPVWPGRELDMLAAYQSDYPRFKRAIDEGKQVLFSRGLGTGTSLDIHGQAATRLASLRS